MPSRRAFVASVAAATDTLAGCAGVGDGSDQPDDDTDTTVDPTDGTTRPSAVSLDDVDPTAADEPIRVVPEGLRGLLADAARTDGVVRGHYPLAVNRPPSPGLAAFETVELRNTDAADGTYTVDVQAGGRYVMQFEAAPAESVPDDATVADGSELTAAQREFVRNATGSDPAEVYPETELGTFARTVLDGGYVRLDGTVYTGRERQQTDAEFFANRVWYVLSLEPVDADDPPVLDCTPVEPAVTDEVAALVAADSSVGDDEATPPSEALVRLAREADAVLLHNLTLRLSVE
ncbi:hypothetical protein [Haloarchaeobius iranensis]|uniref:DUF7979 domain-containing protein n=1 Tax=Haloarchaeobius iranensis TaxID=996166 RepID=A0A1G9V4L4_9EURY|nr:hypothetical protein [Haloarchaeobius iranensis]SDM67099.1 hypothetical protein SAMN05192554_105189 [Haloarchaeobius iranensis]